MAVVVRAARPAGHGPAPGPVRPPAAGHEGQPGGVRHPRPRPHRASSSRCSPCRPPSPGSAARCSAAGAARSAPSSSPCSRARCPGLPLVLLAVVGGIAAVAGALLGGDALLDVPADRRRRSRPLQNLMTVLPGPRRHQPRRQPRRRHRPDRRRRSGPPEPRRAASGRRRAADRGRWTLLLPPPPRLVPELVLVGGAAPAPATDAGRSTPSSGLDWGRCHADPRDA